MELRLAPSGAWSRFAFFEFAEIFPPSSALYTPMHTSEGSLSSEADDTDDPRSLDASCIAAARAGDRKALEQLVTVHQEEVRRLLWRFARTRADLEDLVQDTFLRMLRGLSTWTPQQPFRHWVLRIATNVGRDYFRRQAVRSRWTLSAASEEALKEVPEPFEPGADPAARAAANEAKEILEGLPPDDRALLTLQYLEGWPLGRIAEQFGWTLTATKLRAWRARGRLRKRMS